MLSAMSLLPPAFALLGLSALAALVIYAETHRVPDQP
jgi:hypothetical protein